MNYYDRAKMKYKSKHQQRKRNDAPNKINLRTKQISIPLTKYYQKRRGKTKIFNRKENTTQYIQTTSLSTRIQTHAQAQASRLGATENSDSRSGGWKYPFFGGSRRFPYPAAGLLFFGGGGHGITAGILYSPLFGVSHPSSTSISLSSPMISL